MSTAETISLISSIGAAISAFMAVITCLINVRYQKPKIKLDIHQEPQKCFYSYFEKPNGEIVGMAYMEVGIFNASPVGGTIGGIEIIFKKANYSVETVDANYNPWFTINPIGYLKQDPDKFRLKVPLAIPAFSATMGYFLIPKIFITNERKVLVTVKVKMIENRRKIKLYRKIRFEEFIQNSRNYHLHYLEEIRNYTPLINYADYNFCKNSCSNCSLEVNTNDYK